MTTVSILLSTYNGEKYLASQLDSILSQSFQDWQLIIRDDGSCDKTLTILHEYKAKDNRIKLYQDELGNVGANQSFMTLLNQVSASDYYMFADQDDVWLSTKISRFVEALQTIPAAFPGLVYSDCYYCDGALNIKADSYLKFLRVVEQDANYYCLLGSNFISGCNMGFNHALLKLIQPMRLKDVIYDHWIALEASLYGKIIYIDSPESYYRRHKNTATKTVTQNALKKIFNRNYSQIVGVRAQALLKNYTILNNEQKKYLLELTQLSQKGFLNKLKLIKPLLPKNNFRKLWLFYKMVISK